MAATSWAATGPPLIAGSEDLNLPSTLLLCMADPRARRPMASLRRPRDFGQQDQTLTYTGPRSTILSLGKLMPISFRAHLPSHPSLQKPYEPAFVSTCHPPATFVMIEPPHRRSA